MSVWGPEEAADLIKGQASLAENIFFIIFFKIFAAVLLRSLLNLTISNFKLLWSLHTFSDAVENCKI